MSNTALLFPGQGAQTVGMGRALVESLPAARALYGRAADVLGYDLATLCFEGPAERLDATDRSQPALFVTSLAALEQLKRDAPDAVSGCAATAGLSLGEYSALVFAGAITFDDGLRLVQERGSAMQAAADASPGGMLSILGLELGKVEELCREAASGETLQVANLLCPGNIVVSGSQAACGRVAKLAEAAGAMKTISLAVAGAFHSPLMAPAVERLSAMLEKVTIQRPHIVVIFNVDAQPHEHPDEIRRLLVRQLVWPVRWEASMRYLLARPIERFYEVGPGRVLRGLLKRIDRKAACAGTLD